MNFYVTWAAGTLMATAGVASMFVFSRHPRSSKWLALMQVVGGLVLVSNEALRPGPVSMVGLWLLIVGSTVGNWHISRQAERRHRRNVAEALAVLGDLEKMHRERARLLADEALARQGEERRRVNSDVGIWPPRPPKEC